MKVSDYQGENIKLVNAWAKETDQSKQTLIIYNFIELNWTLFKYQFRRYDLNWLKTQILIELIKIFPRIDIDACGSITSYVTNSLRFELARAHRYETSHITYPYFTRPEQATECALNQIVRVDTFDNPWS